MILMIDNYDSFTYNLVQYLLALHAEVTVFRNDAILLEDIAKLNPEMIVISPGPCTPDRAGISLAVVERFKECIPILGICLGHQAIGQAFGAKVVRAEEPVHGKVHAIRHDGKVVFKGIKNPLNVTRYHSLVLEKATLPADLRITAETFSGEIMGIRHTRYPVEGVQFHPEAILTEEGIRLLENFVRFARKFREEHHVNQDD
ncbi:Para-aminobenzoate/anthranilate synthase glutamine amidotransferase component II [Propionispora sp. 2/2-37]|uniref:anthranilate synthase component II n=1 Tax=Propionispora sp. 2/2-37 TaxID=1677858 RepID=UPI0006BB8A49|nr:aminodeoxychorismate/anthranilate synthase component II [Propionispora sp. 2/2-37]CUH97504.1 Para-aminobenzoate/anthranilate synthase glutamine amidotransferase component II [Propionispora sp. 2/2-37]